MIAEGEPKAHLAKERPRRLITLARSGKARSENEFCLFWFYDVRLSHYHLLLVLREMAEVVNSSARVPFTSSLAFSHPKGASLEFSCVINRPQVPSRQASAQIEAYQLAQTALARRITELMEKIIRRCDSVERHPGIMVKFWDRFQRLFDAVSRENNRESAEESRQEGTGLKH